MRREIDRFKTGYSDRFVAIKVPTIEGPEVTLRFKGYNVEEKEYNANPKTPIMERDFTWCDLFYIAATEAVKDKCVLVVRYPIDSYFNQFPVKVKLSSTVDTEPMILNIIDSKYYPKYPKIRQSDIGTDTSNKFIDTLNISNLFLNGIGGDYRYHCNR